VQIKKLHEMKRSDKGRVTNVVGERNIRQRLMDMGLVNGSEVEIQQVAPLGDPIEIKIKGYNLSLRKNEAAAVNIEVD
jgi:Fe2+ transport system protein FeoA